MSFNYSALSNDCTEEHIKSVHDPKAFPVKAFPDFVEKFMEEVSKATAVPIDFVGVSILTVASALIGNKRKLELKTGYEVLPTLFTCMVGAPGVGKTPALSLASKVIKHLESQEAQAYENQLENYKLEMINYEMELEKWKANKKKRKAEDKPIEPKEPRFRQIKTTDITIEALVELLEVNPILVVKDEFSGFIYSMDQYKGSGKGSETENWLEIYNGEPLTINRKGRRVNRVENPFASVIGGTQPDKLEKIFNTDIKDGFVDRILFSFPDGVSTQAEKEALNFVIDSETIETYVEQFSRLFYLPGEAKNPTVLKMTERADILYKEYLSAMIDQFASPEMNEDVRGVKSKFKTYFGRLILIMHFIHKLGGKYEQGDEVDYAAVHNAYELIQYFIAHAERIYQRISGSSEEKFVHKVVDWIRKHGKGGKASASDLVTGIRAIKNSQEANRVMQLIHQYGYGVVIADKARNGRTVYYITLAKSKG
ncbi:hypothetical protein CN395_25130 [Priestia megaterium]|uniref:YfjI family protein n=1 Tax=Priestia megaterium TaxID=1404 RepID=UPI000BF28A2F|nr:YfjI family protein [Priestia megaterium]PEU54976.1 hypothetical protein CN395_25130 [Priestia megaterium]